MKLLSAVMLVTVTVPCVWVFGRVVYRTVSLLGVGRWLLKVYARWGTLEKAWEEGRAYYQREKLWEERELLRRLGSAND